LNSLTIDDGYIVTSLSFELRNIPKSRGAIWHPSDKTWRLPFTTSNVEFLIDSIPDIVIGSNAVELIKQRVTKEEELESILSIAHSDSPIRLKVPGINLPLYNYQKVGVRFAIANGQGVLIADQMGLGKCQVYDTNVYKPNGISTIGKVFDAAVGLVDDKIEGWFECEQDHRVLGMVGGNPEFQKIKRFYRERVPCYGKFILRDGSSLGCGLNHGFWTQDGWKKTEDIDTNDWIAVASRIDVPQPIRVDEDFAELMAWQIAEGYERKPAYLVTITNLNIDVLRKLKKTVDSFGLKSTSGGRPIKVSVVRYGQKCPYLSLSSKQYVAMLDDKMNYEFGKLSGEKDIPAMIQNCQESSLIVFLRAFFDAEGCCNKDNIELSSKSEKIVRAVQFMLRRLGIFCVIKSKTIWTKRWGNSLYWRLMIGGDNVTLFSKHIGFGDTEKQRKLAHLNSKTRNTNVGSGVPAQKLLCELKELTGMPWHSMGINSIYVSQTKPQNPSRTVLLGVVRNVKKFLDGYVFSRDNRWKEKHKQVRLLLSEDKKSVLKVIDQIEAMCNPNLLWLRVTKKEIVNEPCFVYDFEIDGEPNYFANTALSHNSVQAITAAMWLKNKKGIDSCLVIVPASLKYNWPLEIEKFTDEKYVVIAGTPERRIERWYGGLYTTEETTKTGRNRIVYKPMPRGEKVFFYIVNYELLTSDFYGGRKPVIKPSDEPDVVVKKEAQIVEHERRQELLRPIREKNWPCVVIDECLAGDAPITLADGSCVPIRAVVNEKMDVDVMSYNFETNQIEPKRVVGWFRNSKKKLYRVYTDSGVVSATMDHNFYTKDGRKVPLCELNIGDEILCSDKMSIPNTRMGALAGTLLGDGSIQGTRCGVGRKHFAKHYRLMFTHSLKQEDYCKWKMNIIVGDNFNCGDGVSGYTGRRLFRAATLSLFNETLYNKFRQDGKRVVTREWLDMIDELGLALWYQDDGSIRVKESSVTQWDRMLKILDMSDSLDASYGRKKIGKWFVEQGFPITGHEARVVRKSLLGQPMRDIYIERKDKKPCRTITLHTQCFTRDEHEIITKWLQDRWGIKAKILWFQRRDKTKGHYYLSLGVVATERLLSIVKPYIHPSMEYKLGGLKRGAFRCLGNSVVEPRAVASRIWDIKPYLTRRKHRPTVTYNIEVDGNHNFFAGGTLVSNCQAIKTHSSQRSRAVKSVKAKFRMALTGTPMDGRLEELHSVMQFVMPGLFQSKSRFLQKHAVFDYFGRVIRYKGIDVVRERIRPFFIRRLKQDVLKDLPDKVYENRYIELSPEEQRIYNEIADRSHEITEDVEAMTAVIRCKQFCDYPKLIDVEVKKSSKFESFREVIDELVILNGHKVVVFSQYAQMNVYLIEMLEGMGLKYLYIWGGTDTKERASMQAKFNTDSSIDMMIGTDAMSTGLNFTAADIVINYDDFWSPSVMDQRADRTHRIGQKNVVTVVNFVCKDTIEERIRDVLFNKADVTSQTLGDGTDEVVLRRLGPREIARLL